VNYKISKLQARYGLSSKQSVYSRMKALQIVPVSRGEISSQALDKLDELDKFMKKNPRAKIWEFPRDVEYESGGQLDKFMKKNPGAKIWEFPRNAEYESSEQLDKSTRQLDNFNETLKLVEAIARRFAANQDPLTKYKALEYAANHNILLQTSKVKELTGAKPRKNHFQRGTFIFNKTKNKIGQETAWKVNIAGLFHSS
jgi:hypothetical protein